MAKYFHTAPLPNTCGVGVVGVFRPNRTQGSGGLRVDNHVNPGGAGWLIAGFTNERASYKEAYEELKKKYKMMDQYPVRTNTRSENKFFFVIYDTKSEWGPEQRAEHNEQFKWPKSLNVFVGDEDDI